MQIKIKLIMLRAYEQLLEALLPKISIYVRKTAFPSVTANYMLITDLINKLVRD